MPAADVEITAGFIVNPLAIYIEQQPLDVITAQSLAVGLSVVAETVYGGTLTYQWWVDSPQVNSGITDTWVGAPVTTRFPGEVFNDSESTLIPPVSRPGTQSGRIYYCIITNTDNGVASATRSGLAQVTITAAAPYDVTVSPDVTGGTLTPDPASSALGRIIVHVAPEEGFALRPGSLTGATSRGGTVTPAPRAGTYYYPNSVDPLTIGFPNIYTFQMPAAHVELYGEFYDVASEAGWGGDGTEGSPYLIETVADMLALDDGVTGGAGFAGKHFRLASDLAMPANWMGVGSFELLTPFSGSFDGGGHTVTLNVTNGTASYTYGVGIFAYARDAAVRNLNSAGRINYPYAINVGGIIGYGYGVTVQSCTNAADIYASDHAGGIIGSYRGDVTVTDCDNFGEVNCAYKRGGSGGILGNNDTLIDFSGNAAAVVSNCRNYGYIYNWGNTAGGIVGNFNSGTYFDISRVTVNSITITDCVNYGEVYVLAGARAGGILASTGHGTIVIVRCGNEGYVHAYSHAGGIAGGGTALRYGPYLSIESVYNSGKVYGEQLTGGILGQGTAAIKDAYNTGTVEQKPFSNAETSLGGLVGGEITARLENVYNAGHIKPLLENYVGTLLGKGYGAYYNCYYLPVAVGTDGALLNAGGQEPNNKLATQITPDELRALSALLDLDGWTEDIGVNDGYPILAWQADVPLYDLTTALDAPDGAEAGFTVNGNEKSWGEVVKIAENGTPAYAVRLNKQYEITAWTANGADVEFTSVSEGNYTTYSAAVEVKGDTLVAITAALKDLDPGTGSGAAVWDGVSVDLTWFDPAAYAETASYSINTPAQLMGVAALVNGLVNADCVLTLRDGTVMAAAEWNADGTYVKRAVGADLQDTNSTPAYAYGAFDFNEKTIRITADLDMGGVYSYGAWYGPLYMPIGGQYLMTDEDASTKISSSFNGRLDGGGHYVYNIYCDRHCDLNYGDGQSMGLIGRLGNHDSDPAEIRGISPSVSNLAVTGYIKGNRSIGGIVGKIGKTDGGGAIDRCANFATVIGTDAKGTGGIAGAGWNGGKISNCYNAGSVTGGWPAGGIVGSNEVTLENCYSVGTVASAYGSSYAMGIGTNNGGMPFSFLRNTYYLAGSAPGGGYFDSNTHNDTTAKTSAEMKASAFLSLFGGVFVAGGYVNDGYPIFPWQARAALADVTFSVTPAAAAALASVEVRDDEGYLVSPKQAGGTVYTLRAGETYDYTVTAEGYAAATGSVTVEGITARTVTVALQPAAEPKPGDADGDGDVTVGDALFAAGAVLGIRSLTAAQTAAADMDGDRQITMKDVILIARLAAGL
jgi:hypothetical protein